MASTINNMSVIDEYKSKVFKWTILIITFCCLLAGIIFGTYKLMGFYKDVSWISLGIFLATNITYILIGLVLIKKSLINGCLVENIFKLGKRFIILLELIQFNFILYMIPTKMFWAFTFFFLILTAFFLDLKMIVTLGLGLCLTLVVVYIVKADAILPYKDEHFIPEIILMIVCVTLSVAAIYLMAMFVSKFLLTAKVDELEENRKKTNEAYEYITEISDTINKIAQGDLNFQLKLTYTGDFLKIKNSLDNISDSLNQTIGQIRKSAANVSNSANKLSGEAQSLSNSTIEQQQGVENLAITIKNTADNIKANAQNANNASLNTVAVSREAVESNKRMDDLLNAMQEITTCSNQIGRIIKTIEDIAFQTNILALNAAVEAARAGEAGKGFAVVANEVRNLASKSAEASKNTAVLIQSAITAVESGTNIADLTSESLKSVVNNINDIAKNISTISEASYEQSKSMDDVKSGIEDFSTVVRGTSSTAEASASSSQDLNKQAAILESLVRKFKTR